MAAMFASQLPVLVMCWLVVKSWLSPTVPPCHRCHSSELLNRPRLCASHADTHIRADGSIPCSAPRIHVVRLKIAVETERPASSTILYHDALYDRLQMTGSFMLVVSPLRKVLVDGMSCVAEIGNGPLLALRYCSTGG